MVSTATAAQLLDAEAFNQLVLENGLNTWEVNGYIYAGKKGKNGWELYRAYGPKFRWVYQASRICTQTAGGGGALVVNILMPSGCAGVLKSCYVKGTASAGSTLGIALYDEDGAVQGSLGSCAAGASRVLYLPSVGTSATAHSNVQSTVPELTIPPGSYLSFITSAGLNTETLTVDIIMLMTTKVEPTWTTTGSAGTPSLAASTISDANTWQLVLFP